MRPFTEADFPLTAIGNRVYRRLDSSPICTAIDDAMAAEIALRMNRDNQVYPEPENAVDKARHVVYGRAAGGNLVQATDGTWLAVEPFSDASGAPSWALNFTMTAETAAEFKLGDVYWLEATETDLTRPQFRRRARVVSRTEHPDGSVTIGFGGEPNPPTWSQETDPESRRLVANQLIR